MNNATHKKTFKKLVTTAKHEVPGPIPTGGNRTRDLMLLSRMRYHLSQSTVVVRVNIFDIKRNLIKLRWAVY